MKTTRQEWRAGGIRHQIQQSTFVAGNGGRESSTSSISSRSSSSSSSSYFNNAFSGSSTASGAGNAGGRNGRNGQSQQSHRIVTGDGDGKVQVWEISTFSPPTQVPGLDWQQPSTVETVAFSSNGCWIVSGGKEDDIVRIWSARMPSGSCSGHNGRSGDDFERGGQAVCSLQHPPLTQPPGGRRKASAKKDGVTSVCFSPDMAWVASGGMASTVGVWKFRCEDGQMDGPPLVLEEPKIQKKVYVNREGPWRGLRACVCMYVRVCLRGSRMRYHVF